MNISTDDLKFVSQEYIDMVLERNKFLREQLEAKEIQLKIAREALEDIATGDSDTGLAWSDYTSRSIATEILKQIGGGE